MTQRVLQGASVEATLGQGTTSTFPLSSRGPDAARTASPNFPNHDELKVFTSPNILASHVFLLLCRIFANLRNLHNSFVRRLTGSLRGILSKQTRKPMSKKHSSDANHTGWTCSLFGRMVRFLTSSLPDYSGARGCILQLQLVRITSWRSRCAQIRKRPQKKADLHPIMAYSVEEPVLCFPPSPSLASHLSFILHPLAYHSFIRHKKPSRYYI